MCAFNLRFNRCICFNLINERRPLFNDVFSEWDIQKRVQILIKKRAQVKWRKIETEVGDSDFLLPDYQ